jgi:hypothetical protein
MERVQCATGRRTQEFGICGLRAEELARRSAQDGEADSQASTASVKGAQWSQAAGDLCKWGVSPRPYTWPRTGRFRWQCWTKVCSDLFHDTHQ